MPEPRAPFWRPFAAAWVLLSLLTGLWAIATPIGASPDEPAHLIKAASVAQGQWIGEPGSFGHIVQVPRYIAYTHAQTCYAFEPTEEASCSPDVPLPADEIIDGSTTAGLYNPVYYLITGWPSLVAGDSSGVYAMRIISAAVVSLFLAFAVALVFTWRNRVVPLIGLATAITPMVLFLGGTFNPNSLEIAATFAAFAGMLTIVREQTAPLLRSSMIVLAGAAVASNMRGLSIAWLVVALLAPLVLVNGERLLQLLRRRPVQIAIVGSAVAFAGAVWWLLSSNSLRAAIDDPLTETIAPGVGAPWYYGAWWTFQGTLDHLKGAVGIFGWLDTPSPLFVFAVWTLLCGGLIVAAIVLLHGRARVFALITVGATVILPPVFQAIYISEGGFIWQGRYILPVFACAALGVAAVVSDSLPLSARHGRRLLAVVVALWALAQFHGFATALRRYSVGYEASWVDLLTAAEWSPPGGIKLFLVAFALALIGTAYAAWFSFRLKFEKVR